MPDHFIFVFEEAVVSVFESAAEAESYLEAIDVQQGSYVAAFNDLGQIYQIRPRLDNAELVPTDRADPAELKRRLVAVYGPRHLAQEPAAYAAEYLRQENQPSPNLLQQALHRISLRRRR